jgi:hypothetical protein
MSSLLWRLSQDDSRSSLSRSPILGTNSNIFGSVLQDAVTLFFLKTGSGREILLYWAYEIYSYYNFSAVD